MQQRRVEPAFMFSRGEEIYMSLFKHHPSLHRRSAERWSESSLQAFMSKFTIQAKMQHFLYMFLCLVFLMQRSNNYTNKGCG